MVPESCFAWDSQRKEKEKNYLRVVLNHRIKTTVIVGKIPKQEKKIQASTGERQTAQQMGHTPFLLSPMCPTSDELHTCLESPGSWISSTLFCLCSSDPMARHHWRNSFYWVNWSLYSSMCWSCLWALFCFWSVHFPIILGNFGSFLPLHDFITVLQLFFYNLSLCMFFSATTIQFLEKT